MPTRGQRLRTALLSLLLAFVIVRPAQGQISPGSVRLGGELGPGFYVGEFSGIEKLISFSPQPRYDADFQLKYDIAYNFTLAATIGLSQLSYDVSDEVRAKYSTHFFGPLTSTTYPFSTVEITPTNRIRITKYLLMGQSHFTPSSTFVPYFTLGLGYITFSVTNDQNEDLPTNLTGTYSNGAIVMPVGVGAQYYINDRLSVHGQALFYINSTDYLDGYAHFLDFDDGSTPPGSQGDKTTPSDYMASMMFGVSFTLYQPPPEEPEPEPPLVAEDPYQQYQDEPPPVRRNPPTALDSDGDGLSDQSETERYMTDPLDPDTDADNLGDADEVLKYNTSPNNPDTDADALADGAEAMVYNTNPLDPDTDKDELRDGQEVQRHRTDPLLADTDKDYLGDGAEVNRTMTDPLNPDTDGDTVVDGLDDCPTTPGEVRFRGCPTASSAPVAATPRREAPLSGIPEYINVNDRVDVEGIYFRVNTDDFDFTRPETARNLNYLLNFMQQCDDMGVVIEGHSSSEGDPAWNRRLSEKRARRVRDWLIANGVSSRKLLGTIGYGSQLPKVDEGGNRSALDYARRLNRRITALVRRPCR